MLSLSVAIKKLVEVILMKINYIQNYAKGVMQVKSLDQNIFT